MEIQTVEQFLFEQLEKIAPGKYTLANVLQLFKHTLRFPCSHLKGGNHRHAHSKDYNLSIFRFSTGVTEIKCLYNCGLKIRSTDSSLGLAFKELYDIARNQSTNSPASAEVKGGKLDPGPVPTYSDAYRQRIKDSTEAFVKTIERQIELGLTKQGAAILGGIFPHPDPVESPESIIEHKMLQSFQKAKTSKPLLTAIAVVQNSVPALKPVKLKKIRKTQSRRKGGK